MKYILVGEKHSHNMGEPLLFKCTEYLLRIIAGDSTEINSLDIFGGLNYINENTITISDNEKNDRFSLKKTVKNVLRYCLHHSFFLCNLNYKRIAHGNIGQRVKKCTVSLCRMIAK